MVVVMSNIKDKVELNISTYVGCIRSVSLDTL